MWGKSESGRGFAMKVGSAFCIMLVGALILSTIPIYASASGPVNNNLKNGGLEPQAGSDQGYDLRGTAAPSALSRSGTQALDLGSPGAAPTNVLAGVRAHPKADVPFKQLSSLSFWFDVPNAPEGAIFLQQFSTFDFDGDGAVDACLIGDVSGPLVETLGYQQVVVDDGTTLQVADGACAVSSGSSSIGSLKSDPAWASATLTAFFVQTLVSGTAWPPGFPVLVDDLAVMASFGTLIRIADDADNLCDGASFANVPDALSCAASGATILVAPGTYGGGFVIGTQDVTLCSSTLAGTACDDHASTTTIRGGGAVPIRVEADGVTIRGFTVENPDYATVDQDGLEMEPALIQVATTGVSVLNNILRDPAAPLNPLESRSAVRAVHYDYSSYLGLVSGNIISSMGSATNADGTCQDDPCTTMAIHIQGTQVRVESNEIDGTDSLSPYFAIVIDDLGEARGNSITLPMREGAAGFGAAAGSVLVTIEDNDVSQGADVDLLADGVRASLASAIIRGNSFDTLASGVYLMPEGQGNLIEDNWFGNVSRAVVLDWYGAASLSENTFRDYEFTLSLTPDADSLPVSAQRNDWGEYTRADILATVEDLGEPTFVDVECYLAEDFVSHVCGPTADFSFLPSAPKEEALVSFTNHAIAGAHTITSLAWDFGDGATSNLVNPKHAFADPGFYFVSLTVRDSDGFEDTYADILSIAPIDHLPVIPNVADLRLVEGTTASRWVNATDADGHAIVMSATGVPSWATFTDLGAGVSTLSASPPVGSPGVYPVTVTATANGKTANRVVNVVVLLDAKFSLAHAGAATAPASGNEDLALEADVTNTGASSDSYSFTATAPGGWSAALPGSVTVAPGATARVTLSVLLPALAGNGVVKLTARSVGNPDVSSSVTWNVRVNADVAVEMDDPAPTPMDDVSGSVRVTYDDGSSVVGALVTVKQTSTLTGLTSTKAGFTDDSGVFVFAFGLDAASRVPGSHVVSVTARVVQVFTGASSYDVGLPL